MPKLAKLPDKYIYEPWKAPIAVQKTAGVIIGKDYPEPIVEHAPVSKENMSKMSYAYDQYKEATQVSDKSKKKKSGTSKQDGPAAKKMKQSKLKH